MKRPAFQFYPGDWRANAKLARCSWAARGAWIAVLGLMHDSDEYGVLRWPLEEIASAVGCPAKLLEELVAKQVLKGADRGKIAAFQRRPVHDGREGEPVTLVAATKGPCWYSSRMVWDEHVRKRRGEGSRFTPNQPFKAVPKATPKPPIGDGSSSSSSSSSSSTAGEAYEEVRRAIRKARLPEHWAHPQTERALEAIGGWGYLKNLETRELDFRKRDFVAAFIRAAQ
jgi:hypothetical protein